LTCRKDAKGAAVQISGKIGIVIALTLVLTFPVSVISGEKPSHKSKTIADLPLRHERSHVSGGGKRSASPDMRQTGRQEQAWK
jgi:hypothetical protein